MIDYQTHHNNMAALEKLINELLRVAMSLEKIEQKGQMKLL